ncbi:6-hydroxymethylpterin diphosphokinase MptE-like protein [Paraglaciecola sp. 2405UD69-4]|uniref:6-hydroxymethylpterin diphosphokinase MptE-like protein n=1 Tax=Paraglaciecola sp. 2405UD69-4 TaxID=3391836 RepID=UPI0039C91816
MLEYLKNRHFGERAIIICNGPSLNQMDLSFLKREKTIGLNKIYLGFKKFNFYSNYYVAVNKKVLEQSHQEINRLTCHKFLSNRCTDLFQKDCLTHVIKTNNPPARFSTDLLQGMEEGWTVTYAALQVAYYLGFKDIFIIGMDHRFEYNGAPNAESVMTQSDPNHFSPDYFAKGSKWDNPDLENSERSYEIARQVYGENNRRIFDATVNGNCDIFEKVDYKSIFF